MEDRKVLIAVLFPSLMAIGTKNISCFRLCGSYNLCGFDAVKLRIFRLRNKKPF